MIKQMIHYVRSFPAKYREEYKNVKPIEMAYIHTIYARAFY